MEFNQNNELQQKYDLKHTYASAGIYINTVFKDSILTSYNIYITKENVTNSISENLFKMSKFVQNIILAHFLYTYQNFYGAIDELNYTPENDLNPGNTYDNFSFMDTIISDFLSKDFTGDTSMLNANPSFLTENSWALLTTDTSVRQDLALFIDHISVQQRFAGQFDQNKYPITLICYDNDLNILSEHGNSFPTFNGLTKQCINNTDPATVPTDFRHYHSQSHNKARDLLKEKIN